MTQSFVINNLKLKIKFAIHCSPLVSGSMEKDSGRFILLLMTIFFVKQTSGCCCNLHSCYCNFFGCNCKNPYGTDFCYDVKKICVKSSDLCPDKKRMKSIDKVMEDIQNNSEYDKLYGHLMGIPALNVFYHYDLNKVPSVI